MKLSSIVLAASSAEAAFPWTKCHPNNFDGSKCSKSCENKNMGRRSVKRIMYGADSWVYQVFGTEKVDKTIAKGTYRNMMQLDEKTCGKGTLTSVYQALRKNHIQMELLDKTDGMMKMEHAYANFEETGPDAADYAGKCGKGARGLWIQFKRDAEVRETSADDWMNGKKTRDWYYLQIQNVSGLEEHYIDEDTGEPLYGDMSKVNQCIKSAKMYRMKEDASEMADMTKCVAYAACKKEPDWSDEAPTAAPTQAPTEAPTDAPTQAPTAAQTAGPTDPVVTLDPSDALTPDPNLPDFNNMDYTFECDDSPEVANNFEKCTLTAANGWVFHGRAKDGVVEFKPVRYAEDASGQNRFRAPILVHDYPEPVDGHLDEQPTCRSGSKGQEDCLFLNINVSVDALKNKEKLPIVYFIHGGGFTGGSGMGNKRRQVQYQDVMVVGVNYRLGAWGFTYLHEKEADQEWQGNWGLLDQQAGLKWLHSFAGLFGGDRDQVTLTGGSAGSESCWRQFTIPSSWPYFHRMSPVGIGLLTGIKSPHKIQRLTTAFYDSANCPQNDLNCMRALSTEELQEAAEDAGGSMGDDDVAMVLNGSFGPTHRSDLMPDTLFNMIKNRQIRPNTPFLWTYARDETYGMTTNWIKGRTNEGHIMEDMKSEIQSAISSTGFNNPSPYFDTWLEKMFGNLAPDMIAQFGCGEPGTDCHEQIARFTVATQWTCSTRYALERSYGPENPNGVLYPVEFAQPNCGPNGQKTHACHGAEGGWVFGNQFGRTDFGTYASKAYGAFFKTGSIPADKNYSLKTWEEMEFNDLNQISEDRWGQFGIRREDCAALDKLQEAFDWYNWGISNGDEESMVESSL